MNKRKTFPFDSNPEVDDPLLAREKFAVQLRTNKKKKLISEKRMKLTKSKFVNEISQSAPTKIQSEMTNFAQLQVTGNTFNEIS